MINFFKKPNEKIFNLQNLDRETLIYRVLPRWLAEIMRKYFRTQVEGIENIPRTGPVIIAPNHSGYSGFDAILLSYIISKDAKRMARVMAHQFWFLTQTTAIPAQKMGFIEATYENGVDMLKKKNAIILFPEGEQGNFKPTSKMYSLQEFKRGFIRMAIETKAVIVPTLIIGAEETHINLKKLKLTRFLKGSVIPLPLNIIPLPAKWKIKFLPPIQLPFDSKSLEDRELIVETAEEIREQMQEALTKEIKKRDSVYF